MKTYSLETIKNKFIGNEGSPERTAYETELTKDVEKTLAEKDKKERPRQKQ